MGVYTHIYNQTAIWKKVHGTNKYSEPNVIATASIDCRIEYKNRLVINSKGAQVTSSASLMSDEAISVGDIINTQNRDYTVIQSSPLVDFDGVTQATRVYF